MGDALMATGGWFLVIGSPFMVVGFVLWKLGI